MLWSIINGKIIFLKTIKAVDSKGIRPQHLIGMIQLIYAHAYLGVYPLAPYKPDG